MTVDRNKSLVVGNIDNRHLSEKSIGEIEYVLYDIIESTPRNTAAAIAFAAFASADDILIHRC
jgi:mannose-1-phosphate guanylyltransferase